LNSILANHTIFFYSPILFFFSLNCFLTCSCATSHLIFFLAGSSKKKVEPVDGEGEQPISDSVGEKKDLRQVGALLTQPSTQTTSPAIEPIPDSLERRYGSCCALWAGGDAAAPAMSR
jgi:hypothetical protein